MSVAISETSSRRNRQRSKPQLQTQLSVHYSHYFQPFEIRVTSSTYHVSQVALRELIKRIWIEIPEFPPENLLVELGDYGAFDIRVGNSVALCEVSRTVTYPPIGEIVARLAKAMGTQNGLAELEQEIQQAAAAAEKASGWHEDLGESAVQDDRLDAASMWSSESSLSSGGSAGSAGKPSHDKSRRDSSLDEYSATS